MMLELLTKFGAPAHLVRLVANLHADVRVKLAVGEEEITFESTVGVKQGDTLAPILFLFVVQAATETLEPIFREKGLEPLRFCTAPEGPLTGRPVHQDGDEFELRTVLYADDAGTAFTSREDLEMGTRLLKAHLLRFGLVMHCGRAREDGSIEAKSKTEAVYFPPPGVLPTDDDISPLRVDDHRGIVTFTDRFRYLGSILCSSLTDDAEVGHRIAAAGAVFAQLQQRVFRTDFGNRQLPQRTKGKFYSSFVLSILLYGCESWLLTTPLLNELKTFHHRCVRAKCGVSRCDVREHGGHVALFTRLNVPCVERLISNRKLRWAGHVARMDIRDRLPRKLLLAWVKDVSRPRGRVFSYGHDLSRELKSIGFNLDDRAIRMGVSPNWIDVAQRRDAWRGLVEPLLLMAEAKPISSQSSSAGDEICSTRHEKDVMIGSRLQSLSATWSDRLRPRG